MSEHALPDDPSHWPENPYELLGVSPGVGPRELRRAYTRLIRLYKPEQSPEQFRLIREAYEHVLRFVELFGPSVETPEILPTPREAPSDDPADWRPPQPRPIEEPSAEAAIPARARRLEDEVEELWTAAIAGRPVSAYERLEQMNQQHAGRIEIYLRLYWLLVLWPELDAQRVAADWLVQGLRTTGMAGPLRELYREEVADDPAEALSERYGRLLESPLAASLLADLIEWRFQAAARLKRWDVLAEDVPRLGERFGPGEEQLWLRLLFTAADWAAWAKDPEGMRLLAICRHEIGGHEHLAPSLSHCFDRFDLLLEASSGWGQLSSQSHVPADFLRLIGASWSRPFEEVRESLMDVLEAIAGAPRRWLDHLDEMHERAPATLAVFGELLDRLEEVREAMPSGPRDRELINGAVLSFLPRLNVGDYAEARSWILRFCIQEAIAPEEVAEVASGFAGGWEQLGAAWARALTSDWSLRYVCRSHRLFWA